MKEASALGVVVIGRNEGDRLKACLASLATRQVAIVYVDSGSCDGSVAHAAAVGASVVELDRARPFSAARARNAGFHELCSTHPSLRFVQFVDGDCLVDAGWLPSALRALTSQPDVAVVCGRRRERFPEQSLWNRLCDIEWDMPVGEAEACGGDCLVRRDAFEAVGGFDEEMIAGEEPELCLRLRQRGWRILRLADEMTLHDAAMTRFGAWWRRAIRAGHAYAETTLKHGFASGRYGIRPLLSACFWALALPALALALAPWTRGLTLLLLLAGYGLLAWRVRRWYRTYGSSRDVDALALLLVLTKAAHLEGARRFAVACLLGRSRQLIEYKSSGEARTG